MYIENDERKLLWELAFDYSPESNEIEDMTKIANYYINQKDGYYICELISIASEYLNIDDIINKIIETKDINLISYVMTNNIINGIIDDKYFVKLKQAMKKYL